MAISATLPRVSTTESFGSKSSDASLWISDTGWFVFLLLSFSDQQRAHEKHIQGAPWAFNTNLFINNLLLLCITRRNKAVCLEKAQSMSRLNIFQKVPCVPKRG